MTQNIEIKNLNMTYTIEDKTVTVFENFNLTVNPREFTVIIGKSGCGKTTLLRLIAGLEKPTDGEIIIPNDIKIGMMFQEPRLMPWLNCEQNVMLAQKKKDKAAAREILKLVGLGEFIKARPSELSGGMKQRVAIARTLIRKSNLILMDEPFSSLDGETRKQMQSELLALREQTGAGVLFVTHDIDEATVLGDRIITLNSI